MNFYAQTSLNNYLQKLRPHVVWARYHDIKDKVRLVTHNCPDNTGDDSYLYEILTFTGNWKGSSCDSRVFFELSGERERTPVRVLTPGGQV